MGALLLLVGAIVGLEAARLPHWQGDRSPGPGFLPFWLALLLVALSPVLLRRDLGPGARLPGVTAHRSVLLAAGALVGYVGLTTVLGFGLPTFLLLLGWQWRAEGRWRWPMVAVAAALALGLVAVFQVWLAMPLPRGII